MGNNIALKGGFDRPDFYGSKSRTEKPVCTPAVVSMPAMTDKRGFDSLRIDTAAERQLPAAIFSVFNSLGFVIKVIALFAFSAVYFVLGSLAALIYLILYEKLYKTIFRTPRIKKNISPYYYKWKKHHLELNYEA